MVRELQMRRYGFTSSWQLCETSEARSYTTPTCWGSSDESAGEHTSPEISLKPVFILH